MKKLSGSNITTMCYSFFFSDDQIIQEIITKGYHLDASDIIRGHTILVSAIISGRFSVARWLIRAGSDLEAVGDACLSPRTAISMSKDPGMFAMLEKEALEAELDDIDFILSSDDKSSIPDKRTCCSSI